MSSLILVRHGQASFFASDYDKLSELGKEQARRLGEYWVRRGLVLDEVFTGPRQRQKQTADLVGACYFRAGLKFPEPVLLEHLDEYDMGGMLHKLAPRLAENDSSFAELQARFRQSADDADRVKNFQKAFEALTAHWQTAADSVTGLETWPAFRERVHGTVRRLQQKPGRGRRVAMFTSGGFIGTAVQLAFSAPERFALEMSWRIRNCSLNEFIFNPERWTLDGFNAVPHLDEPELWTYR